MVLCSFEHGIKMLWAKTWLYVSSFDKQWEWRGGSPRFQNPNQAQDSHQGKTMTCDLAPSSLLSLIIPIHRPTLLVVVPGNSVFCQSSWYFVRRHKMPLPLSSLAHYHSSFITELQWWLHLLQADVSGSQRVVSLNPLLKKCTLVEEKMDVWHLIFCRAWEFSIFFFSSSGHIYSAPLCNCLGFWEKGGCCHGSPSSAQWHAYKEAASTLRILPYSLP